MTGTEVCDLVFEEIKSHDDVTTAEWVSETFDGLNAVQKGVVYRAMLAAAYPEESSFSFEELLILYAGVKSFTEEQEKLLYMLVSYAQVLFAH